MDKNAQNIMKLEVILKTDDGRVIFHETVEQNRSSATKVPMAKSNQTPHQNVDKNSLYSENDTDDKEKSCLSKLISCCKSKESKSLTNQKTVVASKRSDVQSLSENLDKPKEKSYCSKLMCCCKSNESQSSTSEETIVVPKHVATPTENFPVIETSDNYLGDSFTDRMAARPYVPPFLSENEVPENESPEKKPKLKTSLCHDESGHWPLFDKKSSETLCNMKNCQNRTHVYCEKCDLHLCFNASRNCFYKFHKRNYHIIGGVSKQIVKSPENIRVKK